MHSGRTCVLGAGVTRVPEGCGLTLPTSGPRLEFMIPCQACLGVRGQGSSHHGLQTLCPQD